LPKNTAFNIRNTDFQELLHRRLTHISDENLEKTLQYTIGFKTAIIQRDNICESCLEGKNHKYLGKNSISYTEKPFELIYTDIAGLFPEGLKGQ
jgi:hypothetical protein